MKKLLYPLVFPVFPLFLALLAGCATLRIPLDNPDGYDQVTADHYRTPRVEENPVVTLRARLDPQSPEYTVVEGRVVLRIIRILTLDGDLLNIPVPQIHEEDRP